MRPRSPVWVPSVDHLQELDNPLGHRPPAPATKRTLRAVPRERRVEDPDPGASVPAHQAEGVGRVPARLHRLLRRPAPPAILCQTPRDMVPRVPSQVQAAGAVQRQHAPDGHPRRPDDCVVRAAHGQLFPRGGVLFCGRIPSRGLCLDAGRGRAQEGAESETLGSGFRPAAEAQGHAQGPLCPHAHLQGPVESNQGGGRL